MIWGNKTVNLVLQLLKFHFYTNYPYIFEDAFQIDWAYSKCAKFICCPGGIKAEIYMLSWWYKSINFLLEEELI